MEIPSLKILTFSSYRCLLLPPALGQCILWNLDELGRVGLRCWNSLSMNLSEVLGQHSIPVTHMLPTKKRTNDESKKITEIIWQTNGNTSNIIPYIHVHDTCWSIFDCLGVFLASPLSPSVKILPRPSSGVCVEPSMGSWFIRSYDKPSFVDLCWGCKYHPSKFQNVVVAKKRST